LLEICHFLQQIITSRLKFYTTSFGIGPHNLEFFEKNPEFLVEGLNIELHILALSFFQSAQKTGIIQRHSSHPLKTLLGFSHHTFKKQPVIM